MPWLKTVLASSPSSPSSLGERDRHRESGHPHDSARRGGVGGGSASSVKSTGASIEIDQRDNRGNTALCLAIKLARVRAAIMLVEAGVGGWAGGTGDVWVGECLGRWLGGL